jgi:Tfp pilus assembly protein PilZ
MSEQDVQQFALSLDSVQAFDQTFARQGEDTGCFFPTARKISVGQKACIRVTIQKVSAPVYLHGFVAWRRVRSGGPAMPQGVYVRLGDRDRARLDGIVRFLQSGAKGKDRRRSQRFPVFAKATYQTAQGQFQSETRNLSEGGVFLRCMGPLLTIGARFPITLYLKGDDAKGFALHARVAWIDLFTDSKGMGVVFDQDQPELKQIGKAIKRIQNQLKHLAL